MYDKFLEAEHALRAHVRDVRAIVEDYLKACGLDQYGSVVSISYEAADEGKWRINHYRSGTSTDVRGAELAETAKLFINTYAGQQQNKSLRALIAAPVLADSSDD